MSSSPSATAPAKAAMARTVTRIARAKASWPSVASSPLRCGSSEVWIDWKSCSGARVMSSALKTTPASAVVAVALTVSTDGVEQRLLGELDRGHRRGEAGARAQRQRALVDRRPGASAGGVPDDAPTARRAATPAARRGCPARRPTARGRGPPRRRPGSRSATPTRRARGRRRARTTGARRGSRGRSSSRRRPASRRRRSSTASPSRRRPRSGPCSARATTRKASAKPAWTSSGMRSGCRP